MEKITPLPSTEFNTNKKYKKLIEQINYSRLSNYLINCGYLPQWLNFDSEGADFVIFSYDQTKIYKIQLKSRVTLDREYYGKGLYIAFPQDETKPLSNWVIVDHDQMYDHWEKPKKYIENIINKNQQIDEYNQQLPQDGKKKHHQKPYWSTKKTTKEQWQDCVDWSIIPPDKFSISRWSIIILVNRNCNITSFFMTKMNRRYSNGLQRSDKSERWRPFAHRPRLRSRL